MTKRDEYIGFEPAALYGPGVYTMQALALEAYYRATGVEMPGMARLIASPSARVRHSAAQMRAAEAAMCARWRGAR